MVNWARISKHRDPKTGQKEARAKGKARKMRKAAEASRKRNRPAKKLSAVTMLRRHEGRQRHKLDLQRQRALWGLAPLKTRKELVRDLTGVLARGLRAEEATP